jgi:sortase (surface protein transpeptidase)
LPFSGAALARPAVALPASMPFVDSAFETVWMRNDQPVAARAVARSWTWGPAPMAAGLEPYADAPDGSGKRLVQYFDKARMEINNPRGNPEDRWFVTNGLLTVELISGRMQVGDNKFEMRKPADIPIASDPDDANAPTYASFGTVSNTSAGEKRQPDRSNGGYATERIDKAGHVTDDPSKRVPEARIVYYEKATGHNIPKVFMEFLNSKGIVRQGISTANAPLLDPWVFAMGLPISDAYWARVKIEGKMQDVLIQAFERRVLTYAPGLPSGWQVQMGNIGQHYYQWRYGTGMGANSANSTSTGPHKLTNGKPALPVRLTIPVLGVHTRVEHVTVDKDNNMDIPKDPANVAWFKLGTVPGNPGNAAINGHLDWYGVKQAVFYYLDRLKPGDRVYVRDQTGRDRAFVVTKQLVCIYNQCPLMEVFGPASSPRLNLITCAGTFNRATQNYDRRTVVFTELAP